MILQELADFARKRVAEAEALTPLALIEKQAFAMEKGEFSFETRLKSGKPGFICEVKKASPSKGIISHDFPYLEIAKAYQEAGASCLSVLTEPSRFLGSDQIFREIRKETSLPMLRKDFTVSEYQLYESKVLGADCILLICAILPKETVKNWLTICENLGLSVLVETHNEEEIQDALWAGARLLGVNNRNLKDFSVDLNNASRLKKLVPEGITFVAESGITSPEDGINLVKQGADALLIGEALMKSNNRKKFVDDIITGCNL